MTSPQNPRAAATPTASPEGVTAELLPCPFCGSAGAVFERGISAPLTAYYGYCSNEECGAETNGYTDKPEAIAAWNRRTPDLAAQQALAGLTDPVAVRANILRGTIKIPDDLVWLHDTHGPVAAAHMDLLLPPSPPKRSAGMR